MLRFLLRVQAIELVFGYDHERQATVERERVTFGLSPKDSNLIDVSLTLKLPVDAPNPFVMNQLVEMDVDEGGLRAAAMPPDSPRLEPPMRDRAPVRNSESEEESGYVGTSLR